MYDTKCFGEDVSYLNLKHQWNSNIEMQGDRGTCYAFAAANVASAYLNRKYGVQLSVSPEAYALDYCQTVTPSFAKIKLKGGVGESIVDGGNSIEMLRQIHAQKKKTIKWATPANRGKINRAFEGFVKEAMLEQLMSKQKTDELILKELKDIKTVHEIEKKHDKLLSELVTLNELADRQKGKQKKGTLELAKKKEKDLLSLVEIIRMINKRYRDPQLENLYQKVMGSKSCSLINCVQKDIKELSTAVVVPNLEFASEEFSVPDLKCSVDENKTVLKALLKPLCAGLPVATTVKDFASLMRVVKKDFSGRWSESTGDPNAMFSSHAMTAMGFYRQNGQQYMRFKNSHISAQEVLVPFEQLCAVMGMGYFYSSKAFDKESFSEKEILLLNNVKSKKAQQFFEKRVSLGLIDVTPNFKEEYQQNKH